MRGGRLGSEGHTHRTSSRYLQGVLNGAGCGLEENTQLCEVKPS